MLGSTTLNKLFEEYKEIQTAGLMVYKSNVKSYLKIQLCANSLKKLIKIPTVNMIYK